MALLPRLSSTASCSYSDLLVNIVAAFRVRCNSAVQRLAKHSRTGLGSADSLKEEYIFVGFSHAVLFQDYRSHVLAPEMAYVTGVELFLHN